MISQLKIHPILAGYRGGRGYDIRGLANVLIKISDMIIDNPLIRQCGPQSSNRQEKESICRRCKDFMRD